MDEAVIALREINEAARARRRLGPINLSVDDLERAERNLFLGVRFGDEQGSEADPDKLPGQVIELTPPAVQTPNDILTRIDQHQALIQQAADSGESSCPAVFGDYVLSRIQGRAATSWLSSLEMQHLHRGCLTLGAALLFGSNENSAALDTARCRAALDRGYSALVGGPGQLLAALAELKRAYQTESPYFSTDMGGFYTWLKEEVEGPKLDEMRHVVRCFIIDNYPLRPSVEILGEEIHNEKRLTFADARQVSGIARARMAITLGHIRPACKEPPGAVTDVSVEDIKTVDEFWNSHSNLKDAAKRLGLHPAQMKAFIGAGVLEAIRFSSALRYVTNASIDAVLAMVPSAPVDHPNAELLPIAEFSQSRCISMAWVVSAALNGEITDVRRNPDLSGIKSQLIDNGQLPIRQRRRHMMDMSVAEAAEHLQIGAMGIRALRDSGYLVQVYRRNSDTDHTLLTWQSGDLCNRTLAATAYHRAKTVGPAGGRSSAPA